MKLSTLIAARAQQISVTGQFHSNFTGVIPSPCLSICRMTRDGSHCEGCFRTLDEIRAWSQADNARRRALWAQALRRAGVEPPKELP